MTMAQITEDRRWQARWEKRDVPRGFIALLKAWRRRSNERQYLATMDDLMLRDIGISRCDAMGEAAKPFWRD